MAETLHLTLLGKPQVTLGEIPVTGFGTAKAEALLYYLAVTGRPRSRETLVDLLWGEMPEAKAKRNLTTTLSTLRKVVGAYLIVEPQNVAFNFEASHQVDVTIFQAAIEGSTALEPADLERDLAPLRKAINLYGGDFLEGFYVKNALSFEEWVLEQREQLRELMLQALHGLIEHYAKQPEADQAMTLEYTTRLLALEPWRESAHRQMMILLARSGQHGAALAQYETCRRILAEELGVEPAAETTALYERLKRTQAPPPHNLPSQPNTFVGRVRELNQLTTHLDNPDCRLLALVGPGGIGKTRLAIKGARQYIGSAQVFGGATFADGVYFVNLTPITATKTLGETVNLSLVSNLLASIIADATGFSFHGSTDQMAQLHHYLREKEMLLVLDNFEHLIKGATLLAELLQQARGVKLVVTSRERLNLMEEWVMELDGLDFPEGEWVIAGGDEPQQPTAQSSTQLRAGLQSRLSNLESYSAIALFVEQVRQVRGDFNLTETETPHVIRICQLVEGSPLALVLAASWLRVLSCEEVAQEIERNLDFLSASQRNIPERHRNLRAVFEQSWQMLSEQEQAVLRKIAVFRGGFRREAAQEVAGASLATLTGLVDKSLLRLTTSGRYEVHELVRQYAAEKLSQTPVEQESIQDGHCRYYARFLQAHDWQRSEPNRLDRPKEIDQEIDNIQAGWSWAVINRQESLIKQGIEGLFAFFWLRSRFQEGEKVFAEAVKGLAQTADKQLLARLQLRQGAFCGVLGRYDTAETRLNYALDTLQITGAAQETALALIFLGDIARDQGRYEEAKQRYEESIALSNQFEDRTSRAMALYGLGSIGEGSGAFELAKQYFLESLDLFRAANRLDGIANGLDKLGLVAWALGEYEESEAYYQESLDLFKQSNNRLGTSMALGGLGLVAWGRGGPELVRARELYEKSLALCRETGQRGQLVIRLAVLGHICNALEAYDLARTYCQEAIALGRDIDFRMGLSFALSALGEALAAQGEFKPARAALIESIEIAAGINDYSELFTALVNWVEYLLREGRGKGNFSVARQQQLLDILTLIFRHPSNRQVFRDKAARLLVKLELILPEDSPVKVKTGPDLPDLDTVVAEILIP